MDGQPQLQPTQPQQPTLILTPPQTTAPLALGLSATLSINLAAVTHYKPVEFFKLNKEGKTTDEVDRVTPCIFFGDGEPVELSEDENLVFRRHWALLQKNTAFNFQIIQSILPPDAPAAAAAAPPPDALQETNK